MGSERHKRSAQFFDELMNAVEPSLELLHRGRIGDADMVVSTESLSGHHGNVRFFEKAVGEFERCLDAAAIERFAQIRIGVKGARGHGTLNARYLAQSWNHEIASLPVFGKHLRHRFLAAAQRFDYRL